MADVLVVDDDADLSELMVWVLESVGHTLRHGGDGAEGLMCLHQRVPDVLVLDVEMPQLSGPEVAYRMLVRDAGLERVPIVLISAVVDFDDVARRVGTPYALAKPFSAQQLLSVVDQALKERRAPVPGRP